MIVPTMNPYAISMIALNQSVVATATPPAQMVTQRPALPAGKSEMPKPRDKRDRDQPEKGEGERGSKTDLVV